ncbi:uncharacterized protein [Magallana gigas]|uniref:uncharacterized protein isoform X2 n=1 Tax=Magallana gigas TaxID=29159 RepID=UPI00333E8056
MKIRLSLFTLMLDTMKGCLIHCVVLQFIPDTMGVLLNSPCTKTSDWSNYHILRCPTNHTIYITKQVIEDGFTKLAFPSIGCSVRDAVYCGVELPTNNISLKNYHIMDSVVNTCNGRNECNLTRQYFLEAEAALKKFCNASLRPELQKATFRHSIDYECIQDSQIIDMCLIKNESRHYHQPVYIKTSGANCTCSLIGSVSRIKILQTMSFKIRIQSNVSNLLGHISIQCHIRDETEQNKEYITTELQKVNSRVNGQPVEDTTLFLTTMNTPFNFSEVATRQFFMSSFNNAPKRELSDLDGILNNAKFWMQSFIVILAVIVLLVTFMLLFSIFKQRKDRNLLLTILQKLDDKCSDTVKQNSKADLSHPRLSEDDKTYQQTSSQFLCHPNTKRFTNSVYETECMVLENAGDDVRGNVMSLESNGSLSMPEDSNPKGVYELQKII